MDSGRQQESEAQMIGDGDREVIGFWTCLESRAAVSLDRVTVSLPQISMSVCKWFSDKKESCSH